MVSSFNLIRSYYWKEQFSTNSSSGNSHKINKQLAQGCTGRLQRRPEPKLLKCNYCLLNVAALQLPFGVYGKREAREVICSAQHCPDFRNYMYNAAWFWAPSIGVLTTYPPMDRATTSEHPMTYANARKGNKNSSCLVLWQNETTRPLCQTEFTITFCHVL